VTEATGNRLEFSSGEIICTNEDKLRNIFLIEEGEVGIFSREKEQLYLKDVKRQGDIIGDDSLFTEKRLAPIAIAITSVTVSCVKVDEIDYVLEKCPDWLGNILSLITDRLKASRAALDEHKIVSEEIENYQLSAEQLRSFSEAIKSNS
jgi:CRP-like cAMP-binding protein